MELDLVGSLYYSRNLTHASIDLTSFSSFNITALTHASFQLLSSVASLITITYPEITTTTLTTVTISWSSPILYLFTLGFFIYLLHFHNFRFCTNSSKHSHSHICKPSFTYSFTPWYEWIQANWRFNCNSLERGLEYRVKKNY